MADFGKKVATALGSSGSVALLVGFAGFISHTSRNEFLGLPTETIPEELSDLLKKSVPDGVVFLWDSITDVGFRYMSMSGVGIAVAVSFVFIVLAATTWMIVRRRKDAVAFKPFAVLPVIALCAIVIVFTYDVPTKYFHDVLRLDSTSIDVFEVPPKSQPRVSAIWMDVVCSKIGNDPNATMCKEPPGNYERRNNGRYFRNFSFTAVVLLVLVLCVLSERKRLLVVGNWVDALRIVLFVIAAFAVLVAVLGVPYVYSRTVRSTDARIGYPEVEAYRDEPVYEICTGPTPCYAYVLTRAEFLPQKVAIEEVDRGDVLREHLLDSIGGNLVAPPPRR